MFLRFLKTVLFGLVMAHSPAAAQNLRIASGDYPPFTDAAAPNGGSINDVVGRMARAAGFIPVFEYLPWKRGLELTRSGRFDAASFWYFSEDRNEDFIHVGPVGQDRLVFFIHSSTPVVDWQDLPDLRQYSFGAVAGYTYTKRFWQLGQDGVLTIQIAPSDEANLRKLRAGRIDLYPMSEDGGWHLIETLFGADATSDFGVLTTPLDVTEAYLLVSRKIAEADTIAKRLQAALDTLTEGNGQQIAEGQSKQ